MRTHAIIATVVLALFLAACAKAPAMEKKAPVPVAEPAAVTDVSQGIDSIGTLNEDVENKDLDTLDSDLAALEDLG
jgi:hypothetical protein